jgi:DNA-binding transcriptional LysR family regulator
LVQIAHVGSFATAANQLNMTLSTLSMQMKTLEEELQVSMFDRSHRPPKLTPIGREIADKAQIVLNAENALLESSHENTGLAGNYRIGFVATASVRLLPLFLKNAKIKAPKANFDLETALSETLEERVLSGQLDAAILTASKHAEAGLKYDVLREETLVHALPSKFATLSIEEMAQELPFLQFNPSSGIGKVIANHVRKLTSKSKKQPIVLDSVEAIMECVNEELGFTLLAEPDIKRYANEAVSIAPTEGKTLSRQLVLATADKEGGQDMAGNLVELFEG